MAIRERMSADSIAEFCKKNGIKRFSLFGSALREDFGDSSDIDVLVEFLPGRTPGLFGIARMERQLSEMMGGRRIDLRTPEDLSVYFRRRVQEEAEVQYVHG